MNLKYMRNFVIHLQEMLSAIMVLIDPMIFAPCTSLIFSVLTERRKTPGYRIIQENI